MKRVFQGFNESTIKYFELMEYENDKMNFIKNQVLYEDGIKQPLEQLFYELSNFFSVLDYDLTINKRRCISSPYNDARFCAGRLMKEYIYIRFKVNRMKKENTLGFFFDASKTNYRYGLNIYNLNSRGMELIRNEILTNRKEAKSLIKQFNSSATMKLEGKRYVRDYFPAEEEALKKWLNMRTISICCKEEMNSVFFERTLLDNLLSAYSDISEIYFFLKRALH